MKFKQKLKFKQRHSTLTAAVAFATAAMPITATYAQSASDMQDAAERQLAVGIQAAPKANTTAARSPKSMSGPNPFLARVIDPTKVDFYGWRSAVAAQARSALNARNAAQGGARNNLPQPVLVDELEPDNLAGLNDTLATGELISGVATDVNPRARVLGTLAPPRNVFTDFSSFDEDDGSISSANETGVANSFGAIQTSASIGDGPHGFAASGSGDYDFYSIDLAAGQTVTADTDVFADFDSVLVVYDAAGDIVAANDDDGVSFASRLSFTPADTGTYYVMVTGFGPSILPEDPFDSGSGLGAGSEGAYDLLITTAKPDIDVYAIDLKAGDVIGASITGAGNQLQVFATDEREAIGSTQDVSALYPVDSPLPGGGNAVLAYPAAKDGRHFVAISGSTEGNYDATFEVYRAGLANERAGSRQRILLDFDGARVQTAVFGGPGTRELTGLAGFLGGWGLGPDDEEPLIDAIVKQVKEDLRRDLRRRGLNPDLAVKIIDSRTAGPRNQFGRKQVSRIVVGGTIAESGIPTLGVASAIDPGNFGHEDDALVLLDLLSAPIPDPNSINTYLAAGTADRIRLIAQGLANIISHEAGHYLGNYHTDQFNDSANIMDQGGNLPNILGAGVDELLGTSDDVDVDFGIDLLVPNEGLTGMEDTLNNTAFGLSRSR